MSNAANHFDDSNAVINPSVGRDFIQHVINVHGATPTEYVRVLNQHDVLPKAIEILDLLPLDRLPHRSPGLPPHSRLAFAPVAEFVGREIELRRIASILKSEGTAAIAPVAVITGYGGVGKTSLANEFVHRYGQYFAGGVFWLSFAQPASVSSEIADCGRLMALWPASSDLPLNEQVQMVNDHWHSPLPRLLIFDNCEDASLIRQWRPKSGGCRVLVTSRRLSWEPGLGMAAVAVNVLPRQSSCYLLRQLAPRLSAAESEHIAAELADLPLALHLAGSFLQHYPSMSAAEYLNQVREQKLHHVSLTSELRRKPISPTDHDLSIYATFNLSYSRLEPADPVDAFARRLLSLAACFAPGESLPRDLLLRTAVQQPDQPPPSLKRKLRDLLGRKRSAPGNAGVDFDEALARLGDVGLLEADGASIKIHRLIALFALDHADPEAQPRVETMVTQLIHEVNRKVLPLELAAVQPHLRHVVEQALRRSDQRAANLAENFAYYLDTLGEHAAVRSLYEQALAIYEQLLGAEHPVTVRSLNNLASALKSLKDYAAARPLYERALAIREATFKPDSPEIAASLNNLASLLKAQREYAAARPLYERALAISEKSLGKSHRDTATALNNLASLLNLLGEQAAARPLYERALAIREATLGKEHYETATSLNNLALLLWDIAQREQAVAMMRRAASIFRATLGEAHQNTQIAQQILTIMEHELDGGSRDRPL